MKIVEPVLFPITYDILECVRIASHFNIKDCDLLLNFNFQKLHYDMIIKYIEPEMWLYLEDELASKLNKIIPNFNLGDLLELTENHIYKNYFRFIICDYLRKNEKFDLTRFKEYLTEKHDFTYKMNVKPKLIDWVDKYYNTLIIPRLWRKNDVNRFNRIHNLPANYHDDRKIIETSSKMTLNEGVIYLLNPIDFHDVRISLPKYFKFSFNENFISFKKDKPQKSKTRNKINFWL